MPRVRKGEPEKDFVNRAVPVILKEKDVKDRKHAVAKAHGIWQQSKKKKKKKSVNPSEGTEVPQT